MKDKLSTITRAVNYVKLSAANTKQFIKLCKDMDFNLPAGKRPKGRLKTCWRDYAQNLALSRLGIPPMKLPLVAKDWDAWRFSLELLSPQTQKDNRQSEIHSII